MIFILAVRTHGKATGLQRILFKRGGERETGTMIKTCGRSGIYSNKNFANSQRNRETYEAAKQGSLVSERGGGGWLFT